MLRQVKNTIQPLAHGIVIELKGVVAAMAKVGEIFPLVGKRLIKLTHQEILMDHEIECDNFDKADRDMSREKKYINT